MRHHLITITQASAHIMKKLVFLAPFMAGLLAVSLQAGPPVVESKEVAPAPPPPEIFGTGFYMALDLGANCWQARCGARVFSNEFGDTLTIDPTNDVGFYGGLKAGWVFGTGVFRPT